MRSKRECEQNMLYQENRWKQVFRRGRRWEYLIFLAVLASLVYIIRRPSPTTIAVVIEEKSHFIGETSTNRVLKYEKQTILPRQADDVPPSRTLTSGTTKGKTNQPQQVTQISNPPAPVQSKHVAICAATGRLGNLMFTFASVYGIAKRKNMSVVIDESNPLLQYFKLDAKPVKIASLHGYQTLTEARACDYDERVTMFDSDKDVLIKNYLQSWKYFIHVEDRVRAQFRFSDSVIATADKILSKIRNERSQMLRNANVTVIGLHYRRGDKIQPHFEKFGYQMAPMDYVKRAMTYFRLLYEHTVFVLASDSTDYMKKALPDDDVVYLDQHPAIEDLATMARCDHLITTIGTFGWWAGFLSSGNVLYYKYPAREGSGFRKDFGASYSNYFHPKWTGLR